LGFGNSFSEEVRLIIFYLFGAYLNAFFFFFSTLTTFYYGNLTYPSQDPPKMGFLSTVPSDASSKMQSAVSAAANANNNFPGMCFSQSRGLPVLFFFPVAVSEPAPTGSFVQIGANAKGVPQATYQYPKSGSASHVGLTMVSSGGLGLALLLLWRHW
jgi:hypothetical protein